MPRFEEGYYSPLELELDTQNPRFILPVEANQEAVRAHLLKHEHIKELIAEIIQFGGIMPGERPIICSENGKMVVIEGNRRVCAYQLLLNPSLIPQGFQGQIPAPTEEVVDDISQIPVDIISSRPEAAPILASRHIEGIRRWPTLSKMQFFWVQLENGKSIDNIERESPGIKRAEIRNLINHYYLFKRAISLPVWTEQELMGPLNQQDIEVTRFTRIFDIKRARSILGLTLNNPPQQPQWKFPANVVDKILELIMRAAFISRAINTRTSDIWKVPGLREYIESLDSTTTESPPETKETEGTPKPEPSPKPKPADSEPRGTQKNNEKQEQKPSTTSGSTKNKVPGSLGFFETISANSLNPSLDNEKAILTLAREIQIISKPAHLRDMPNAAAMLLRSLLEQSMKRHLKKIGQWDDFARRLKGKDPGLQDLISFYRSSLGSIFESKDEQRLFNAVFLTSGVKDTLNLVVHQTDKVAATKDSLVAISKAGLFGFIQLLLEK